MSGIEFTPLTPADPEYYAELLSNTPRPVNRRNPSGDLYCPNIPGIQNVDGALAQRLQTLLDVIADISLCQKKNVSATMARLRNDSGTLETRIFIALNHKDDDTANSCSGHLTYIFEMLRKVPKKSVDGSPRIISDSLTDEFLKLCRTIHTYSLEIFAYRVTKRSRNLSDIKKYINEDPLDFSDEERAKLQIFFRQVDTIIKLVEIPNPKKQVIAESMEYLLDTYHCWTSEEYNILPKDGLDNNRVTFLDAVDERLANNPVEGHRPRFQLRRWATKIMSLLISANRLFLLTQSHRLQDILVGRFEVEVLPIPPTTPYRCILTSDNVQEALDVALAGATDLPAGWEEKRDSFVNRHLKKKRDGVCWTPTVHAELAMIMAMDKGEIERVFPYIGVSKLSCLMCSHYIDAFNEVTKKKVITKGSHGKAYTGWSWPRLPNRDEELRPAFLKRVREQLHRDFKHDAERQLSDSSAGSGGPEWEAKVDLGRNMRMGEEAVEAALEAARKAAVEE